MNIVLFEDQHVGQLAPITLSRPAYAIGCGSLRLLDLARDLGHPLRGVVRQYLGLVQQDYLDTNAAYQASNPTVLLNARLVPDATTLPQLWAFIARGEPGRIVCEQGVAALLLPPTMTPAESELAQVDILELLNGERVKQLPVAEMSLRLFCYPHDVVAEHETIMPGNLEYRLTHGSYNEIADGVFVAEDVSLPRYVEFDTSGGPVVLESGVHVGPFSFLQGPLHADQGARISPHSHLKGTVSLGHTTKVGGEVGGSIIEPYSNKQHDGHLGNAYLGSWVNLGAGTTNSNLKNTYGTIRVEYETSKIDTGMQFFGCVMGDYCKTAINTTIFTGKTIGVCSNVYGTVTTNVPSFANYARSFGEVTDLPPEVMETTQKRMFMRRGIQQRPCDVQLLRDMYELVAKSRNLAKKPPSF